MSIATFYVRGKSKKEINERLAEGRSVHAENHSMFEAFAKPSGELAAVAGDGDVIKVYEKMVGGSPYAKAYGNWNAKKQRIV